MTKPSCLKTIGAVAQTLLLWLAVKGVDVGECRLGLSFLLSNKTRQQIRYHPTLKKRLPKEISHNT